MVHGDITEEDKFICIVLTILKCYLEIFIEVI